MTDLPLLMSAPLVRQTLADEKTMTSDPSERPMKALTLHRPWAGLIAARVKDLENRNWPPPASLIGQRLAIHAGKRWDNEGAGWAWGLLERAGWSDHDLGELFDACEPEGIVALVTVGAPVTASASPWFIGRYGWPMLDVVRLPEPIPCRGAQRLWTVPDDVAARVLAQVARGGGR